MLSCVFFAISLLWPLSIFALNISPTKLFTLLRVDLLHLPLPGHKIGTCKKTESVKVRKVPVFIILFP